MVEIVNGKTIVVEITARRSTEQTVSETIAKLIMAGIATGITVILIIRETATGITVRPITVETVTVLNAKQTTEGWLVTSLTKCGCVGHQVIENKYRFSFIL